MDHADRDAALDELAGSLRDRLLGEAARHAGGDLHERIRELVDREAGLLDDDARARLATRIAERSFGLGPLEPLLGDPSVDEVMVNGPGQVWVERDGRIEATTACFAERVGPAPRDRADPRAARAPRRRGRAAVRRAPARRLAGQRRRAAARARRLGADDPPVPAARVRPRRPRRQRHLGAAAARAAGAARSRARCNVLISGGTGSGKTTTLNALTEFIGDGERIVTVEDAAELRLRHPHVVRLEARPASLEGRGEVTVRRLVRNALRMRPDRIVVGEVRGAEALDMLSAMSSGPRRLAVDRPRRVAGGGAAARRDARADGRARPAARGGARSGRGRARPRRPPGADGRRVARGSWR